MDNSLDKSTSSESVLHLERLAFEKLDFDRTGFDQSASSTNFQFKVGIAKGRRQDESQEQDEREHYKITLEVIATRENEFEATVCISGYFWIDKMTKQKDSLLKQNAVAILFPYVRSEFTLLTTQPNVQPIMMPVMNVFELMNNAEDETNQDSNLTK